MSNVSIIIPTYNGAPYVFQCVDSALKQTYKDIQIVLVDDGSTDATPELCEFFRKTDSRVTVLRKPNGGLVSARKAGLELATGEYVFYLDGDDWIEPTCIERYVNIARKSGADVVIGNYKREFLGTFTSMRNCLALGHHDRASIEKEILPRMISCNKFFSHGLRTYSWGKLYRRSLIAPLQVAVPDQVVIGEDAAVTYPAIYRADSIFISDLTECVYRKRPSSILASSRASLDTIVRFSAALHYLSTALNTGEDRFGFLTQLQAYFTAGCLILHGAHLADPLTYEAFEFFGHLPAGASLAVFNSGTFGQNTHRELLQSNRYKMTGWFDFDYKENQFLNMPVQAPELLKDLPCDFILVPSFELTLVDELLRFAASQGIPRDKLRLPYIDLSQLGKYIEAAGFSPSNFSALLTD